MSDISNLEQGMDSVQSNLFQESQTDPEKTKATNRFLGNLDRLKRKLSGYMLTPATGEDLKENPLDNSTEKTSNQDNNNPNERNF